MADTGNVARYYRERYEQQKKDYSQKARDATSGSAGSEQARTNKPKAVVIPASDKDPKGASGGNDKSRCRDDLFTATKTRLINQGICQPEDFSNYRTEKTWVDLKLYIKRNFTWLAVVGLFLGWMIYQNN